MSQAHRLTFPARSAVGFSLFAAAIACSEAHSGARADPAGSSGAGAASSGAAGGGNSSGGGAARGATSAGGVGTGGGAGNNGGSAGSPSGGAQNSGGAPVAGAPAAGGVAAEGGAGNGGSGSGAVGMGAAGTGAAGMGTSGGASGSGGAAAGAGGSAGSNGKGGAGGSTPGVRIVGRTAAGTAPGSVRFSWPGVNIRGRFTGTQVAMDLNDGNNGNRFTVVVDGGMPRTVTTTSATTLSLATGLANGTHDIVVWRNTEVGFGITQFTGLSSFGSGGTLLAATAAPDRRIEVIGDSLSAGAGVEGNATCTGGIDAYTNNYLAYGSVAARAVGADVVTIAWSGIGVYRNYSGNDPTMPARYPYSITSTNTLWDFSLFQPHVVVINLGTNDFGAGDPGTPYETAYIAFVRSIRTRYASANFILIDMYGGDRRTRIDNVVSALRSGGENKVEVLSVSSAQNNLGCNQHPNVAGQAAMGAVLANRLRSLMSW